MKKPVFNNVKNILNFKMLRQKHTLLIMALAGLLYFAGIQNGSAQTYNFSSDAEGSSPAAVSHTNGTIKAATIKGNRAMMAEKAASGSTAVFNMDLFPSVANYSVTWKETYTTGRRSGFMLRTGTSNNPANAGAKTGYLFQVNTASSHQDLRIYKSTTSGYTLLKSQALVPQGTDQARWYRATVKNNQLTFEYSIGGISFMELIDITDNTFSSGKTQYLIGFGKGVGNMYIDNIKFNQVQLVLPDVLYNFESDAYDNTPANVVPKNGTATVVPVYTKKMAVGAASSGNTSVLDMTAIPAASDYSIRWDETYKQTRRGAFLLRGSGSNSTNQGAKQGYLFQVNTALGNVRIYRSNASGYTLLKSASLAPAGANETRWYRATVKGSTLTFEYSDDGFIYNTIKLITVTDSTYSHGTTQYSQGYGKGHGQLFIDNVKFSQE